MKIWSQTWDCSIPRLELDEAKGPIEPPMDHEAFATFYERTARPLWAYLARVSGDAALADDLLQETYLRFLGANVPEGEIACRRYLFRIATNLLRDYWRRPKTIAIDDLPERVWNGLNRSDPESMEAEPALTSAFKRMRPRERQLLWLAYAEGSTHREIAQVTGLRETSVRLLLFRAKRKLARFLRGQPLRGRRA